MEQPVVQLHQQPVPVPRHFDTLIPFHAHLKPEYFAALQQHQQHQQNEHQRQLQLQLQQQHRLQQQQQQQQPLQGQHHLLPQRRHFAPTGTAVANSTAYINSGLGSGGFGPGHIPERLQEHQLRRKTPSGTIDAGYDGSPASLATGPPPLKQMAMAASSSIFPVAAAPYQDAQVHQRRHYTGATPTESNRILGPTPWQTLSPSVPIAAQNTTANLCVTNPMLFPQADLRQAGSLQTQVGSLFVPPRETFGGPNVGNNVFAQPVFAPSYQTSPGPTAFNSVSFHPPPFWPDSALLQGQPSYLYSLSNIVDTIGNGDGNGNGKGRNGTDNRFVAQNITNIACDSAYVSAAQPMFPPVAFNANSTHQVHNLGQQTSFCFPVATSNLNGAGVFPMAVQNAAHFSGQNAPVASMKGPNMPQTPVEALEMLSMGPSTSVSNSVIPISGSGESHIQAPLQFKERVLAHAEKTYADLLMYLAHSKNSFHGKPLPSFRNLLKRTKFTQQHQQQQQQQTYPASYLTAESMRQRQQQVNNSQQPMPSDQTTQGHNPYLAQSTDFTFLSRGNMFPPQAPLAVQAKAVLDLLFNLCEQSGWKWIEGMLLGGCLLYALERFEQALEWFKRVSALRPDSIELLSNIAATLHCLDRREEAIEYWLQAVRAKPSYLEPTEMLSTILSADGRHREAVEIITFVQNHLRLQKTGPNSEVSTKPGSSTENASPSASAVGVGSGERNSGVRPTNATVSFLSQKASAHVRSPETDELQPGFGSSGYALPGHDNGRILALIHAKANVLYALKDIASAAEAYEEAVLIGVGREFHRAQDLIQRIHAALSPPEPTAAATATAGNNRSYFTRRSSGLRLLPPDTAKLTAHLVFPSTSGQLPGLRFVVDAYQQKAGVVTASNALLSLAKILQDGMASSACPLQTWPGPAPDVADILSLYYLSLSLQESPSTANNVGILLASVQPSRLAKPEQLKQPKGLDAQLQAQQQQFQSLQQASWQTTSQRPHSNQLLAASGGTPAIVPHNGGSPPSGIPPGSGLALAFAYYNYGLQLDPKHVHLHTNLGSLLKDVGHLDLAIKMYEQAVACDGTFDIALTNLANAVKDRGRVADAISYYRRAVAANPDFAEAVCGLSTALNSVCDWRGRGGVVLYNGRYDRWHVGDDGMLQDVRKLGRGCGLMQRVVDIVARQLRDGSFWGRGVLDDSAMAMLACQIKEVAGVSVSQGSVTDLAEDSGGSRDLGADDAALNVTAELQKWSGQPWEGSRVLRLIERATRVLMRRWYLDRYVRGVESPKGYARLRPPASLTDPGAPTVLPFHTFTCPLPAKEVRLISQRNALRISCSTLRSSWLPGSVYQPPAPPQPQLNIGYISSDFNNHPLAHLMQSVFGFHNQARAKAFCYATTASDNSFHRQKIEQEAPVFRDVTGWSPERLIEQILQDGIHILVNLNGYTRGARNEIFAARPAPIQMAFMGFAGTLGAEWCDYLLADTTAVPPSTLRPYRGNVSIGDVFRDEASADGESWIYSENIIYSRDSFFCCDHKQSADPSERGLTWDDERRRRWKMRKELFPQLSDDAVVLANFNQLYKIDPTTFRSWLRILAGVPNAVLWLLRFPELGESNLKATAVQWAGQNVADRIIFTDVAAKHLHITRARVCDLFLDTPECNAHTTAADVLWSSTPLVTLPRYDYKMCSRIAASVLKGALPKTAEGRQAAAELIADDESQYEQLAIKLASSLSYQMVGGGNGDEVFGKGVGRLAELRELLWHHKWTCGLFDTRRWVSDLEDAYEEAWRRWVAGTRGDIYL